MVVQKFDLNETPIKKDKRPAKVARKKHPLLALWLAVIAAGLFFLIKVINSWFETNEFKFHRLITLEVRVPITIEKRKPVEVLSPLVKEILDSKNLSNLDPVEQVILKVFGIEDYRVARAIAIHENNYIGRGNKWDAEAWNTNTNRTIDVGIFQINSVHFNKPGCSFKELLDVEKNVLCAKSIYDAQSWEPWVVFQTGSFKRSL